MQNSNASFMHKEDFVKEVFQQWRSRVPRADRMLPMYL